MRESGSDFGTREEEYGFGSAGSGMVAGVGWLYGPTRREELRIMLVMAGLRSLAVHMQMLHVVCTMFLRLVWSFRRLQTSGDVPLPMA